MGDQDTAASDRRNLLGLMRLDQSLSKLNLTLLATTFWNLLRFWIAELNLTDQRAIAPPPVSPLAISLFSIAAERLRSAARHQSLGKSFLSTARPLPLKC
jgi:hypothetical protein